MTTQIHCTGNGGQIKCVIVVLDGNVALVSKIGNVSQSAGINNENLFFFYFVDKSRKQALVFGRLREADDFSIFFVIRH